jgi:hypothetical protein
VPLRVTTFASDIQSSRKETNILQDVPTLHEDEDGDKDEDEEENSPVQRREESEERS